MSGPIDEFAREDRHAIRNELPPVLPANTDNSDSVRAEYDVDEWLALLRDELMRQRTPDSAFRMGVEENEEAVDKLVREVATLRAKLEACTTFAAICAEDLDSPEETGEEFWARFRAAQDAFLAVCGITLTPDDTPEV